MAYLDRVGQQLTGRGHVLREVVLVVIVRLPVVIAHLLFTNNQRLNRKSSWQMGISAGQIFNKVYC
jgi:hypothetical protein